MLRTLVNDHGIKNPPTCGEIREILRGKKYSEQTLTANEHCGLPVPRFDLSDQPPSASLFGSLA